VKLQLRHRRRSPSITSPDAKNSFSYFSGPWTRFNSHPVSGKSLARQNALRAAGGKKGLADKLRRTRSGKTSPKVRVPMAEVQ